MNDEKETEERQAKPVKILDAEITEDGYLVVEFNQKLDPEFISKKAVVDAEMLFGIVKEYGQIPPKEETDFPGLPHVSFDDVFGGEDGEGGEEETEEPEEDPATAEEE